MMMMMMVMMMMIGILGEGLGPQHMACMIRPWSPQHHRPLPWRQPQRRPGGTWPKKNAATKILRRHQFQLMRQGVTVKHIHRESKILPILPSWIQSISPIFFG